MVMSEDHHTTVTSRMSRLTHGNDNVAMLLVLWNTALPEVIWRRQSASCLKLTTIVVSSTHRKRCKNEMKDIDEEKNTGSL